LSRIARTAVGVDGIEVQRFTLSSSTCTAVLTDLGARLLELHVPDRSGVPADVALQRATLTEVATDSAYMGATVGRYANRIRHGRIQVDGRPIQLSVNEGEHHLHGGLRGFDRKIWSAQTGDEAVTFWRVSPAGEEGYPGTLTVSVTYRLTNSVLSVAIRASTDAPTVANIVHHPYVNLGGHDAGTVDDHVVAIAGGSYLPVDEASLPTGEVRAVAGTPFDFRTPARVGGRGVAFDHAWVLDGTGMRAVAVVEHPGSGRRLTVSTNQPGLQFYAGGKLEGLSAKGSAGRYPAFAGLALEAQNFPDAPNHPNFPSAVLLPGQTYANDVEYAFSLL
jgi:aldose 1-epimerase